MSSPGQPRHCPGCHGYSGPTGWDGECPGTDITTGTGVFTGYFTIPPLNWLSRLKILTGKPVQMSAKADTWQFVDITDLAGTADVDDLTRPGGPWQGEQP